MISINPEVRMGGMGSGRRWHLGASDTTDDYRSIDVRCWRRSGLLAPHQRFDWRWARHGEVVASIRVHTEPDRVTLTYRHRRDCKAWEDESYPIYLDWTTCHLGGQRPWFLCPAPGCGRRVALLYGGVIFACRHCHRLAYPSQRENEDDRAARRADSIRAQLGWKPGIFNDEGAKPKGMHWRTFEHLTTRHDAFVSQALARMTMRLSLPGTSLAR
jgi:hypothetical protein